MACHLYTAGRRQRGRVGEMLKCSLIVLPCSLVTAEGQSHPSPAAMTAGAPVIDILSAVFFYILIHASAHRCTCTDTVRYIYITQKRTCMHTHYLHSVPVLYSKHPPCHTWKCAHSLSLSNTHSNTTVIYQDGSPFIVTISPARHR